MKVHHITSLNEEDNVVQLPGTTRTPAPNSELGPAVRGGSTSPDVPPMTATRDGASTDAKSATDADSKKIGAVKKLSKMMYEAGKRSPLGFLIAFNTWSGHCEDYAARIGILIDEGNGAVNLSDSVLEEIRIKMIEGLVADVAATAAVIVAGGAAVRGLISAFAAMSITVPGAGWMAAAFAGATYFGLGYAVSIAAKILTSQKIMEPFIKYMLANVFDPQFTHNMATHYARAVGANYVRETSLAESESTQSTLAAAGKEFVVGDKEIQAALKKAKENGITTSNAKEVLDKKLGTPT
jgi:hypothetical protein